VDHVSSVRAVRQVRSRGHGVTRSQLLLLEQLFLFSQNNRNNRNNCWNFTFERFSVQIEDFTFQLQPVVVGYELENI